LSDTASFEPPLVDLFLGLDEWLGCLVVDCQHERQQGDRLAE
jgi:hypothetical protein